MEYESVERVYIGYGYGKVLLLGGFCVLNEGGKGVALSLNPSIRCECKCRFSDKVSENKEVFVNITTQFGANSFNVDKVTGNIQSSEFEGLKFLRPLFKKIIIISKKSLLRCECMSLRITADKSFYIEDGKTGLGSSSAFTVAISKAVFGCLNQCDVHFNCFDDTIKTLALEVHKEGQGGIGSGYDILTNIYGSVFMERRNNELKCSPIKVPACLELAMLKVKSLDKKGTSSSEQVKMFNKFVSIEQKNAFISAVNDASFTLRQTFEELNVLYNDTEVTDKERIIKSIKKMKEPIKTLRGYFQTLSKLNSSLIIEPPELKPLLDTLNKRNDVLLALVPGAGGYDAPCVLGLKGWHKEFEYKDAEVEVEVFGIRNCDKI